MWRQNLGCSAIIAIPFFLVGLFFAVISVVGGAPFGAGAIVATMPAMTAFVAALFLFHLDRSRWTADRERIRSWLLTREDTADGEFLAKVESADHELATRIRHRLAEYFEVPSSKIQPDDELKLLSFDRFMPAIYFFVLGDDYSYEPGKVRRFPHGKLKRVMDLVVEAKRYRRIE